jgi:peptide/nickel transport system substrate-binding protein
MRFPRWFFSSVLLVGLVIFLSACGPGTLTPPESSSSQLTNTPEQTSPTDTTITINTPTQKPTRNLVICLPEEPDSLYLYAHASDSTMSVLQAIYDGPFDVQQSKVLPVILDRVPSFENGDASFQAVDVQEGDLVSDVNGDLVALAKGARVMPAGCTSSDCSVEWDGASPLQMDQLTVTFQLLENLTWSDHTPLSAYDSVYSFKLASDPHTPISKYLNFRTSSYQALDERTVQWAGIPGYAPSQLQTLFWTPLPEHLWKDFSAGDLITAEISNRSPLGWGPYVIQEWVPGDHIMLAKNPAYFRSNEGLPKFDFLVYRFLNLNAAGLISAVQTGECDIVDHSPLLDEQLNNVLDQQRSGLLKAYIGAGPDWEAINFGITPASYDDGYAQYAGDRPDYFSDVRVRQAFAFCMDRQGAVDQFLSGQSSVPTGYYLPTDTLFDPALQIIPYDPDTGRQLLEEAGWRDVDGDPSTPLQAEGIPNIQTGTPLVVEYYTTQAALRQQVAQYLADSMIECGIQVNLNFESPEVLLAPGPDGIVFGRQFDLAEFSWKGGSVPACQYYQSDQVPSLENNWLTINVSGYQNPAFDQACLLARSSRPDDESIYLQNNQAVQRMFSEELPVIPLYYRLRVAISRPDLCGLSMDVSSRSSLWNLETIDYGNGCQ